jgi:hemoglobin-like flavoprotein
MLDHLKINVIQYSWERILRDPDAMMKFYDRLFIAAPETRKLFPEDLSKQSEKLAYTIGFVVTNIDRLDSIKQSIEDLGRVHNKLNIKAEYYDIVITALIETIQDVMGQDFMPEIGVAWREALEYVSKLMINAPEKRENGFKKLLSKLFPSVAHES